MIRRLALLAGLALCAVTQTWAKKPPKPPEPTRAPICIPDTLVCIVQLNWAEPNGAGTGELIYGTLENKSGVTIEDGYLQFTIKQGDTILDSALASVPARIGPGSRAQFVGSVQSSRNERYSNEVTFSLSITDLNGKSHYGKVALPFQAVYSPGPWWRKQK